MRHHPSQHGFTLVELSIVLVVIGMLVGGVLVGQNLIHAGEIRGTINVLTNTRTAYNLFREKYLCIPGDCKYAEDFFDHPDVGNGDGDGLIRCGYSPPVCPAPVNEHLTSILELGLAGLVPRREEGGWLDYIDTPLRHCYLRLEYLWQDAVFGNQVGNYLHVAEELNAAPWQDDCMMGEEAFAIDTKIDDGYASSNMLYGARWVGAPHTECTSLDHTAGAQSQAEYNQTAGTVECSLFLHLP